MCPTPHDTTDSGPALLVTAIKAVVALMAGGILLTMAFLHDPEADAPALAPDRCSSPGLQTDPPVERMALRGREDDLLTSYGWVDQDDGAVRIPIERAMSILSASSQDRQPGSAPVD